MVEDLGSKVFGLLGVSGFGFTAPRAFGVEDLGSGAAKRTKQLQTRKPKTLNPKAKHPWLDDLHKPYKPYPPAFKAQRHKAPAVAGAPAAAQAVGGAQQSVAGAQKSVDGAQTVSGAPAAAQVAGAQSVAPSVAPAVELAPSVARAVELRMETALVAAMGLVELAEEDLRGSENVREVHLAILLLAQKLASCNEVPLLKPQLGKPEPHTSGKARQQPVLPSTLQQTSLASQPAARPSQATAHCVCIKLLTTRTQGRTVEFAYKTIMLASFSSHILPTEITVCGDE